jgi:hypothetical protein
MVAAVVASIPAPATVMARAALARGPVQVARGPAALAPVRVQVQAPARVAGLAAVAGPEAALVVGRVAAVRE